MLNNKIDGKRINCFCFIYMHFSQHMERILDKCIVQNANAVSAAFAFAFVSVLENHLHGILFGALLNAFEFGMRHFPRAVNRAHIQIMRFYNALLNVAIAFIHFRRNIFEKRE